MCFVFAFCVDPLCLRLIALRALRSKPRAVSPVVVSVRVYTCVLSFSVSTAAAEAFCFNRSVEVSDRVWMQSCYARPLVDYVLSDYKVQRSWSLLGQVRPRLQRLHLAWFRCGRL